MSEGRYECICAGCNKHFSDDNKRAVTCPDCKALRATGCDWPAGARFEFFDPTPDDHHTPCYVSMPGGALLPISHHNGEGVDVARAKFIVAACNAALNQTLSPQEQSNG